MDRRTVPGGVEVYEINGPFFFGAAQSFKDAVSQVAGHPKVLILRIRNVPAMDSSGVHALLDVIGRARKEGTIVVLSGVHEQPLAVLTDSSAMAEIGNENVTAGIDLALARARAIVSGELLPV
ncbi:MAG: sodium-independent anion transporter [Gemmatimonadota bacterium]